MLTSRSHQERQDLGQVVVPVTHIAIMRVCEMEGQEGGVSVALDLTEAL